MKTKYVLPIALILLIGVVVLVSATHITDRSYQLQISEGWNVIYNFWGPDYADFSGISEDSIKAVYGFNPINQEYVRFYPNPEEDKIFNSNFAWDDYSPMSAFFVYSDKDGMMSYSVPDATDKIFPVSERQLMTGWNFIGVTKEFQGNSFNELKGSCEVTKVGTFDIATDSWDMMTDSQRNKIAFEDNTIYEVGRGIIIKVTSDCKLGSSSRGITNPPTLPDDNFPNDESGQWDNYIYEGVISTQNEDVISTLSYRSSSMREGDCYLTNQEENCIFYKGTYEYNGDEIDVVDVRIEVPTSGFELTENILNSIDRELSDGREYSSDDDYYNNNFIWVGVKQNEETSDIYYIWENEGKLFLIIFDDIYIDSVDDNLFTAFIDKYITKYPSSIQR